MGWEFRGLRDRKDKDATALVDFTGQAFAETVRSFGEKYAEPLDEDTIKFAYFNDNEAVASNSKRDASSNAY